MLHLPSKIRHSFINLSACATILENGTECKSKEGLGLVVAAGIFGRMHPSFSLSSPRELVRPSMPFDCLVATSTASLILNISPCFSASTLSKFYLTEAGSVKFMFVYVVEKH